MSKVNKIQIYAIRWLNSQNYTNDKIAEELKLNIEQVNQTVEKYSKASDEPSITTKKAPVNNPMITKTSGKGTNNVAIMTQEASSLHDSMRSSSRSTTEKSIFRPKNNG
jgi:hypothetical protein